MTIIFFILMLTIITGAVWIAAVEALRFGLKKLKPSIANQYGNYSGDLKVSVLIAARNEAKNIGRTLEALSRQDYPTDQLEVIVIDDNSTDDTVQVVQSYIDSRFRRNDKAVHNDKAVRSDKSVHNDKAVFKVISAGIPPDGIAPKKNALAKGIEAASGEIILTTDADCLSRPGWITGMVQQFEPGVDAVVGFSPLEGKGITGAIGRFDALVNAVVSAGSIGFGKPVTAVGRNFAYRKSAWESAGGFGSSAQGASGDDDLLLQRIAGRGGSVRFSIDPSTYVESSTKETLAGWWKMKRRHFSAGKRYDTTLVIFAIMLYLFQVGLLLNAVLIITGVINAAVFFYIWGMKVLFDGITLARGAKLLHARKWFLVFIIGEIISPVLFILLVPSSLFGKVQWKGRSLNN